MRKVQWLHSRNPREISADRLPFLCSSHLKANGTYYDPRCLLHQPQRPAESIRHRCKSAGRHHQHQTPAECPRVWRSHNHRTITDWRQKNARRVAAPQSVGAIQRNGCPHHLHPQRFACSKPPHLRSGCTQEKNESEKQAGLFWSEIDSMCHIAGQKNLPAMVGFCIANISHSRIRYQQSGNRNVWDP